jgi:hypothetical protein
MPPIAIILVFSWRANVAELADALDLGSSARKSMGVRPSPFAPKDLDLSELGPCLSIVTVFVTVPPGTRPSSDLRPSGLGYSQCRTADKQIRFGARRFHVLPSAAVPRAPCFERQTYADRESESRRRRDSHANLHPVVMDFSRRPSTRIRRAEARNTNETSSTCLPEAHNKNRARYAEAPATFCRLQRLVVAVAGGLSVPWAEEELDRGLCGAQGGRSFFGHSGALQVGFLQGTDCR